MHDWTAQGGGAHRAQNLPFPAPALLVRSLSLALGCFEAGESWEVFRYWKVQLFGTGVQLFGRGSSGRSLAGPLLPAAPQRASSMSRTKPTLVSWPRWHRCVVIPAGPRLARAAALPQRSPSPPFPSRSPLPILSQPFPQALAMLRGAAAQPPASPRVLSTKFSLEDGPPLASKESLVPRTEASDSPFNWYKGILYSV